MKLLEIKITCTRAYPPAVPRFYLCPHSLPTYIISTFLLFGVCKRNFAIFLNIFIPKATNLHPARYAMLCKYICQVLTSQTTQLWIFPFYSYRQPVDGYSL
jgi:hypothetical protein